MKKTAIILFNLGGPDTPDAVQPFLFNLFSDPAIIRLPHPLRYLVAKLISTRRAPIAREIYAKIGGASPILKNTQDQATALDQSLNNNASDPIYKSFITMRCWHPFAEQTVKEVQEFAPDNIILLPLYPQYSTTTSASSLANWHKTAQRFGLTRPTRTICCYPQQEGFIRALATSIRTAYLEAQKTGTPRILFSAHGLPEKIVKQGDPYQAQCELTAEALRRELALDNLDSVLCFQSRVGPMKWIGPATDEEILRAGRDKIPLVVAPIAFVSDHSETLVEIDIEYRHLATENGVPSYHFVPAVGTTPAFIEGLAELVRNSEAHKSSCTSSTGARICPNSFSTCPCS